MIGKIEVLGLDELDKQLAKLDDKVKDKALSKALNHALNPMRKDAKLYASVAPEPHTMIVYGGHGVAMGIYVGKGTKQKEYPNYWHFVEYGTSKMPAVPFLRPAFDKNVQVAVNAFAKTLKDEIDKIVK